TARKKAAGPPAHIPRGPEMHETTTFHIRREKDTSFRIRVHRPSATSAATIVYFHGGGWVLGDIDTFDELGRTLAAQTAATVLLVEYRKAPEHPFPTAVEDAWTALN